MARVCGGGGGDLTFLAKVPSLKAVGRIVGDAASTTSVTPRAIIWFTWTS